MNQSIKESDVFYYIAFMLMASTFLNVIFANLPPIVRSHHVWTLCWFTAILLLKPHIIFNRHFFYFFIYLFFLIISFAFFWRGMDLWNYRMLVNETYQIIVGLSVITYFYSTKNFINLAKLTKWSLYFLAITGVTTTLAAFVEPKATRILTGGAAVMPGISQAEILQIQKYGAANYSTVISFMCLAPLLVYFYKSNKSIFSKKHLFVFGFIISLGLIRAQLFSNLLIAITFSLVAFFGVKNIRRSTIFAIMLFMVAIIIPKTFYIDFLISIANLFSDDSVLNSKFKDLALFLTLPEIENSTTGIGSRANRYFQLWESFFRSPWFGVFHGGGMRAHGYFNHIFDYGHIFQVEGTHIHWMNKLTITGIIGLMIFFYIPYSHIRNKINHFDSDYRFYFLLSSLAFLSYGLLKTVSGREGWYTFFIILPGIHYLPLLNQKRKK